MAVAFYSMQRYLMLRPQLLVPTIGPEERAEVRRRNRVGLLPYLVATAAAPLSSYLVLAICAAVGAYYALPAVNRAPQES